MNFIKKTSLAALLILALPRFAMAGTGSSGGGIGVQCGSSVQVLDLYEARNIAHLKIETPSVSLDDNYVYFAKKFMLYYTTGAIPSDAEILKNIRVWVTELFRDVPAGSLDLSRDATLPAIPDSCRFVQIALYDDSQNIIKIDRTLWKQLSVQDQAALAVHESVYKMARENRSKTSDETRKVIGLIFSNEKIAPMWGTVKDGLLCTGGFGDGKNEEFSFFVFFSDEIENGVAGMRGYFALMNGYLLLSRTTVFIPGKTNASVLTNGFDSIHTKIKQPLINRSWNLEIVPHPLDNPQNDFIAVDLRATLQGAEVAAPFSRTYCQMGHIE